MPEEWQLRLSSCSQLSPVRDGFFSAPFFSQLTINTTKASCVHWNTSLFTCNSAEHTIPFYNGHVQPTHKLRARTHTHTFNCYLVPDTLLGAQDSASTEPPSLRVINLGCEGTGHRDRSFKGRETREAGANWQPCCDLFFACFSPCQPIHPCVHLWRR